MKVKIFAYLFGATMLVLILTSCRKETWCNDDEPVPAPKGNLIRIQQGTSPDLRQDTVKLITYDNLGRIHTIIDSMRNDTLFAFYDNASRLSLITMKYTANSSDSERLVYDAAGLLTQIDFSNAGQKNKYTFEYNNGKIYKRSYFTDVGLGGPLSLWRYFIYEFTGGNITNIKEYTLANQLFNETRLTYGPQLNPFKNISLFNFANKLGTDEVINIETYFNTNILTGSTDNSHNPRTITIENIFNSAEKPVKIVSRYDYLSSDKFNYIFTRYFSYN